jgi:hypothetical protein
MNYKIIGADQKEYGPVTGVELQEWILQSRVNLQTLIQPEGSADWKPLSEFPELTTGVINTQGGPMSRAELEARVAERPSGLNLGGCFNRAWKLVSANLFPSVAATFLVFLTLMLLSIVPFLGGVVQLVLQGVLIGGLFFFFLKLIRGQRAEIGDAFAGFTNELGQLALGGLVPSLLALVAVLVVAVPLMFPVLMQFMQLASSGGAVNPSQVNNVFSGMGILAIVGIVLAVTVSMLLNLIWIFTLPLIIDKKIGFWDAMEVSRKAVTKNLLHFVGLGILMFLTFIAGIVACLVGVLIAFPLNLAMISYAYEDIFTSPVQKTS